MNPSRPAVARARAGAWAERGGEAWLGVGHRSGALALPPARDGDRADHRDHEQGGGKLERNEGVVEERPAESVDGSEVGGGDLLGMRVGRAPQGDEDRGHEEPKDSRPEGSHDSTAPLRRQVGARPEQHDDEEKENDDGPRVDDELYGGEKLGLKREKEPRYRHDEEEESHRAADRPFSGHDSDRAENGEPRAYAEVNGRQPSHGGPLRLAHVERESRVGSFALAAHVRLEVLAELVQEAERGHSGPLPERADRVAHDAVGDVV